MGIGRLVVTVSRQRRSTQPVGWTRVRMSVVVPIGVIVAVAIVCVVVAVLGSAQRADEVALEQRAATVRQGARRSRRAGAARDSRASPPPTACLAHPTSNSTPTGCSGASARWLQTYFDHDFVFVVDSAGPAHLCTPRPPTARCRAGSTGPAATLRRSLDHVRGRAERRRPAPVRIGRLIRRANARSRIASRLLQTFLGRPAIVAAVAIANPTAPTPAGATAPLVSERQVHRRAGAGGDRLAPATAQPAQARRRARAAGDYVFDLYRRAAASSIAQFAWTPQAAGRRDRPKRHPLHRGRARRLRAARRLVLRYMRRTAATIAAGENAAAPSRAARPAVRPAEPHLLRRAAGSDDRRGAARAAPRRRCSTSTSTISRTSTTRSAIRSATN